MRRHGWQLPYHPLQVVALAVFLALGFAFYVFFLPFAGAELLQHMLLSLYTPLITCVIFLYVWCAATDPSDPGVLHAGGAEHGQEAVDEDILYCNLCEVQVKKNSKHCRLCDKCVDGFDHHCRWLNNCIGRRNYRRFFTLMVTAVILLVVQSVAGLLVLVLCGIDRQRQALLIGAKLGSSFKLAPFVVVVGSCTFLAMVAAVPLAQLLFFHVLLIKKGISTYDYVIAMRDQELEQHELEPSCKQHQSPQLSVFSSRTGFTSASSFAALQRGMCTPPSILLEDQLDVVHPNVGTSIGHGGKNPERTGASAAGRGAGKVKISPWALARLDGGEISKAAAEARKKSRVLQPVDRRDNQMHNAFDANGSSRRTALGRDTLLRANTARRFPAEFSIENITAVMSTSGSESKRSCSGTDLSACLAPLQLEARSAFRPSWSASCGGGVRVDTVSSPGESSLHSPDLQPFRVSSHGAHELRSAAGPAGQIGSELSTSTSDGCEASGGEESDAGPTRIVYRSLSWTNVVVS